jgi:hypothetical protein
MKIIAETALTSVLFGIFIFLQVSSDPLHFVSFEDRLDLSAADRTFQYSVVHLVLIGIRHREIGDNIVELVALTQIHAYHCGIPGGCVGERQRVATTLGEDGHLGRVECLDGKLHLDVPELADIEVTSSPTVAVTSARPMQSSRQFWR